MSVHVIDQRLRTLVITTALCSLLFDAPECHSMKTKIPRPKSEHAGTRARCLCSRKQTEMLQWGRRHWRQVDADSSSDFNTLYLLMFSSCCPCHQGWRWPWLLLSLPRLSSPHFSFTTFSINSLQLLLLLAVVLPHPPTLCRSLLTQSSHLILGLPRLLFPSTFWAFAHFFAFFISHSFHMSSPFHPTPQTLLKTSLQPPLSVHSFFTYPLSSLSKFQKNSSGKLQHKFWVENRTTWSSLLIKSYVIKNLNGWD